MKAKLRIDEPGSGLHNMSVDEALLRDAEREDSLVLRIYRWQSPTLSLGHFQRESDIPNDVAWGQIDRVTRKTGGGAIVHDLELTYSLVIPHPRAAKLDGIENLPASGTRPSLGSKGPSELIYRAVHTGLVDGLQELGLDARLAEECTCKVDGDSLAQSFLCFERRSPVDIVIEGAKVVGSAQRRTQFGLLQHGSILLRRSHCSPHLKGILDFLDPRMLAVANRSHAQNLSGRDLTSQCPNEADNLIDWERWTNWLVKNLQVSVEKAFAGYWLFG